MYGSDCDNLYSSNNTTDHTRKRIFGNTIFNYEYIMTLPGFYHKKISKYKCQSLNLIIQIE